MEIPRLPVRIAVRLLMAIFVALAIAAVTIAELENLGTLKRWQVVGLGFVVGLAGPGESLVRAGRDWRGLLREGVGQEVREQVNQAVPAMSQLMGAPIEQVGVTVFHVQRVHGHLIRGIQVCIYRLRLSNRPKPSGITWTRKKGILGRCWQTLDDVSLDHQEHFGPYRNATRKEWNRKKDDVTMGLTFRDFCAVRDYGFVVASPLIDEQRYLGCIVLQVPSDFAESAQTGEAKVLLHHFADAVTIALR